ncbi:Sec-independent protein translocase protein TatB [Qipengyuania sp. JC766]|uniref:Sec-independent protein translocase protein TatB n=1 Tax=Qipengyuania sp. JC766 TaxID=3232139 RepID=UPI003457AE94
MFDVGATELLLIIVVAIIVIGPKDMPGALRTAGRWVGKIRRTSAHFRAGFDAMVREAEMEEMERKWKEKNAKIMAETPEGEMGALPTAESRAAPKADKAETSQSDADDNAADQPALPLDKPKAD